MAKQGGLAASTSAFFQAQPWEEHTEVLLQEWATVSMKRSKVTRRHAIPALCTLQLGVRVAM
tara:strand:- start:301 stop:486 length:186 start_codon:yes stop_codon:yes gene_type:complete